jgi:hypothetical protein
MPPYDPGDPLSWPAEQPYDPADPLTWGDDRLPEDYCRKLGDDLAENLIAHRDQINADPERERQVQLAYGRLMEAIAGVEQ